MAYDEGLAERVREILTDEVRFDEKKMFGGLCFLVGGNMCCGIVKEDLMVRVGADRHEEALGRPHARPMDFTGRPMTGMIYVGPDGYEADEDLSGWVALGLSHARSLPPKAKGGGRET